MVPITSGGGGWVTINLLISIEMILEATGWSFPGFTCFHTIHTHHMEYFKMNAEKIKGCNKNNNTDIIF